MKAIPILLDGHYQEDATTVCLIVRVLTKKGVLYGFTDLDADVVYDPAAFDPHETGDDWGSATHYSENGFTPSRMQASADLAVDNSEISGLILPGGITVAMIRAGLFDYARVRVYRVNYMDLSQGHEVAQVGTYGETRHTSNGWLAEFRSLTQQLKQPISRLYSLTCRARFGSMPIGTGDGSFEEKFPCEKAFTWTTGEVTAVGASPRRQFTDDALAGPDGYYDMGVIEWLTGNNAGAQMEVDTHASDSSGDSFGLALPMPYEIQVGDTYRVRKDCSKEWDDADNGCLFHWGTDRKHHFRGEPDTPISDGGQNMVPGAQVSRSS